MGNQKMMDERNFVYKKLCAIFLKFFGKILEKTYFFLDKFLKAIYRVIKFCFKRRTYYGSKITGANHGIHQ
jgi:hypothetical protein